MPELEHLRIRWTDAIGEHFELARAAWRITDGYEQDTFDGEELELNYMRRLIAKFDELREMA